MVYRMDADSFIMAFIRFSRSRGITPATAYSDNGTNITAGEKELRNAFDNLVSDPNLPKKLAERRTQWVFFASIGSAFRWCVGALSTGEQTSNKGCPERAHGVRRSADDRILRGNGVNEQP